MEGLWPNRSELISATRTRQRGRTWFASCRAFSHNPFAICTLLRLMKRCGVGKLRDSAAEYHLMALSSCCVSAATSPRHSSFDVQCFPKAKRELSRYYLRQHACPLTYCPCRLLTMRAYPPSQFIHHLEETFTSIQCTVNRIQTFADCTINRESRGRELHTGKISGARGILAQRKYLRQQRRSRRLSTDTGYTSTLLLPTPSTVMRGQVSQGWNQLSAVHHFERPERLRHRRIQKWRDNVV